MMPRFIRTYKVHLILFFVALAAQLAIFFLTLRYGEGGFLLSSDAEGYFEIGKNLAQGNGFILHPAFGPQALRPPLYPLFVAALYTIIPNLAFVILVQNILAAGIVVGIYSFGRVFFEHTASLVAALLFLFESQRLQVTNQVMSETLFTALFIAGVYYALCFFREGRSTYAAYAGIFFGLATLTRPISQYLPFLYAALFIIWLARKKQIRFAVLSTCIFLFTYILTLTPWLVRNKIHFNIFSLSATGGANLYYVNAAHFLEAQAKARGEKNPNVYPLLVRQAIEALQFNSPISGDPATAFNKYGAFQFKYDKPLGFMAARIIADDPWLYVKLHTKRMVVFFIESSASRSYSAILAGLDIPSFIFYPTLYWGGRFLWGFFIFIAVIAAIRQRVWQKEVFLYYSVFGVTMLYFAFLAGLNYDAPRMRLPVNPLLFLIISYSILSAIQHKKPIYAPA